MKTLLTGATGFVGSAVLRKLIEAGHEVRVLVREGSDCRNLTGLDIEIARGDLIDGRSVYRALKGCENLLHVAADYRLWAPEPRSMYEVNVKGTRTIMRAAADSGARRIVYTSSVATLGLNRNGSPPADESTPARLGDMVGQYKRTKYIAEHEIKRMIRLEGLPAVIVHPSTPVGPRDIKPTPTGKIIVDAARGRMPAYVDTGLNMVHVEDVAAGHLLALHCGRIGESYILGAENLTLKEILTEIASLTGCRVPRLRLSPALILPIAYIAEFLVRNTPGKEPFVTTTGVRLSMKKMFFSCEKAVRELGYRPRPAREGLRDAVNWFREKGYIRQASGVGCSA